MGGLHGVFRPQLGRRTYIARFPTDAAPARDGPRVNAQIAVPTVRLVKEDGTMVGVTPTREALRMAEEVGLDLVEISPNADPPVCKILDFGKYKYEIQKKKRAIESNKKLQSASEYLRKVGKLSKVAIALRSQGRMILVSDEKESLATKILPGQLPGSLIIVTRSEFSGMLLDDPHMHQDHIIIQFQPWFVETGVREDRQAACRRGPFTHA